MFTGKARRSIWATAEHPTPESTMPMRTDQRAPHRLVAISIGATAATLVAGLVAAAVTSVYFARVVLTPPRSKREEIAIVGVSRDDTGTGTITLSSTADTRLPGRYSLWFNGGTGHAQIGDIVDRTAVTVTRELVRVNFGSPESGQSARIGGWFHLSPAELGFSYSSVDIQTELGPAPAWFFPADDDSDRWAIIVHGRSVQRPECLRAVPVFRDSGFACLLISYRNDGEAPETADGRYGLGSSEWRDVEHAIDYAVANGARDIVLMGWSMGGATVIQTILRPKRSSAISAIVLESPVVDWPATLRFHGSLMGVATPVVRAAIALLGSRRLRGLARHQEPIDFASLDVVARASELQLPTLLLHSDDDGYVPAAGSIALAGLRPDIIRFERFKVAGHTKLWNFDPDRWNSTIREFLATIPRR